MRGELGVQELIRNKIQEEFDPLHLDVVDESHKHRGGSESHFKILVVSNKFEGQSRVDRQRSMNELLRDELAGPIHALMQRLLTPAEWKRDGAAFESPDCAHKKA